MFIQTEATPNPATLKFLPGRVVMPEGTFEAKTPEQGEVSPLAQRLFAVCRRLARALRSADGIRADGVNLFVADGVAAGQDVFHAHLHVIPRFAADGFAIDAAAWRSPPPDRAELDRQATAIRKARGEI